MSEKKSFDAGKAVEEIKKDRNLSLIAGGAVAVIVGLFLPWYTFKALSLSSSYSPGLNGTGVILLALSVAAVAAALNVLNQEKKMSYIASVVAAVLALLVILNKWPDTGLGGAVSTGIGYWVGLIGAAAMIVGSALRLKAENVKK